MSEFYDDLLDESDALARDFLRNELFSAERFAAHAEPEAPWVAAPLPAPAGMRHWLNVADTSVQRCVSRATSFLVAATLSDAIKATAADASGLYKCMETELMGSDVLVDAQVLEIVRPRTKESPHDCVTLKHVKYRSVLEEYQAEDFLLVETSGKGVGPDGLQYAFKLARSVDIPGADEVLESDDVRLELHRGWIHHFFLLFTETQCPGVVRMDLWLDADVTQSQEQFHGGFSGLHDAFSLAIRYRHLVENYVSVGGRATGGVPTAALTLFPSNYVAAAQSRDRVCQMCTKKVGIFSLKRRHVCAICGIFLCSPCVTSTEFNSWKLCALCCDRNESLISRHTVSRLASNSLAKLTYMAKVKMGFDKHRQSLYGGERSAMINRRATVASTRKHSGSARMSLIQKTSGKTAYDVIAEGGGGDGYEGRGSLFDTMNRPTASQSTPRQSSYQTSESRAYSKSTTNSGYSTASTNVSTSSDYDKIVNGSSSSNSHSVVNRTASVGSFNGRPPAPEPPVVSKPTMSANDYYLSNITRTYSISKSRIQLLNDDQHNRLSARTTWRSSAQSDFAEIHSIPEAAVPRAGGARGYYEPAY